MISLADIQRVSQDASGFLPRVLDLLAGHQANVVHIYQASNEPDLYIDLSRVDLDLETRGFDNIKEIETVLNRARCRAKMR